jgi:hypothetical protein
MCSNRYEYAVELELEQETGHVDDSSLVDRWMIVIQR